MRSLVIAAAVLVGACATSTPYQAQSAASQYGFEEQTIETNRVRISFNGNSLTDRRTVENYMLYRAAETTLERGYDYFIVANRDTEEHSRLQGENYHPRSAFDYRYYHPRYGWAPWYDPFWDQPTSYREVTRYEAVAEIAMFSGQKPADNPSAFDARQVQANLQGEIVRPPAEG